MKARKKKLMLKIVLALAIVGVVILSFLLYGAYSQFSQEKSVKK